MLTQKDIDENVWLGDQRALVTELLARAERAEEALQMVNEWCEPIGTGTGGDGDALNIVCELYEKTKAFR